MLVVQESEFTEVIHHGFHIQLIICIVALEMLILQKNQLIYVILTAIHSHRKLSNFYLTPSGLSMDILKSKEMVGLGTREAGSLMLALFRVACTSTRLSQSYLETL